MCERLPPRESHVNQVRAKELDVLVIGGGATGAGCTVDAASRGMLIVILHKNKQLIYNIQTLEIVNHKFVIYNEVYKEQFNWMLRMESTKMCCRNI